MRGARVVQRHSESRPLGLGSWCVLAIEVPWLPRALAFCFVTRRNVLDAVLGVEVTQELLDGARCQSGD
jgi:hypothetical protein